MSAKRKTKKFFRWLIFIGIIVIAFATNPEKQSHIEKINNKLYGLLPENQNSSIIKKIGELVSNPLLERVITYDNYYVFSVSKVEVLGKSENVSYGVFGMVFLTDKVNDIDL